jgi:hypothetical protein
MRPVTFQLGPYAAASAASLLTAGVVGAGALALTGTTLDVARRLLFTSSANDSGITFTVIGTDGSNNRVTEVVTGALSGSTARTVLDYKALTSISSSGASAGTLSIGTTLTSGVASSPWVRLDDWVQPGAIGVQAIVSAGTGGGGGTINFSVQYTSDDPNSATSPVPPYQMTWFPSPTAGLSAATTNQFTSDTVPQAAFARILVNSATNSAQIAGTFRQVGSING